MKRLINIPFPPGSIAPDNKGTPVQHHQPKMPRLSINGNSLIKWLGHSTEEQNCRLALAGMGLSIDGGCHYDSCDSWQAGHSLSLKLIDAREYRQRTARKPYSQGKWIIAGIQFCRADYAPHCRQDFSGTLPFGLTLTNTAGQLGAILGKATLDVLYEDPDHYFRVMGWVKGNIYLGIACRNTLDSAVINCCGVSILGTNLGWGEAWLDDLADELDRAV